MRRGKTRTLGRMNDMDTPVSLAATLTEMFPAFALELEDESVTSYHQVIQRLTPMITRYLQEAPKQTVEAFCVLVNEMVAAGGDIENAISTCLLEHASQVKVGNIIRPYLNAAAKQELR
jgi:hypothetical protein